MQPTLVVTSVPYTLGADEGLHWAVRFKDPSVVLELVVTRCMVDDAFLLNFWRATSLNQLCRIDTMAHYWYRGPMCKTLWNGGCTCTRCNIIRGEFCQKWRVQLLRVFNTGWAHNPILNSKRWRQPWKNSWFSRCNGWKQQPWAPIVSSTKTTPINRCRRLLGTIPW